MISKVVVFVYLPGELEAVPAGTLTIRQLGREISNNFVYGTRYVQRPNAIELDPFSLAFKAFPVRKDEVVAPKNNLALFGAFRDATPDSWGRRVIEKEKNALNLPEITYITHSFDDRVGALDFRDTPVSEPRKHPYHRVIDIQYLMDCAEKIDRDEPVSEKMLRLFQYGSSMGGARPKAVVEDEDGLWLAKFKAESDRFNYAKVELATLRMAQASGIRIPDVKLLHAGKTPVVLIKRFDRDKVELGYARRHFVSALTMLGKDESESITSSYAEIAQSIAKFGGAASDKVQLFRRMIFNILVSNTDDHLRNHGFIYADGGYQLSPAYDIVPTPTNACDRYQHLAIGNQGRLSNLKNALSNVNVFGLSQPDARDIVKVMTSITLHWKSFYLQQSLSEKDIEKIAPSFRTQEQMDFDDAKTMD